MVEIKAAGMGMQVVVDAIRGGEVNLPGGRAGAGVLAVVTVGTVKLHGNHTTLPRTARSTFPRRTVRSTFPRTAFLAVVTAGKLSDVVKILVTISMSPDSVHESKRVTL